MKASGEGAAAKAAAVAPAKKETMVDYLKKVAPRIQQYLPRGMNADRFMRIVYRAFVQNPKLAQATKPSLIVAIGLAAELGLEPNGALGLGAIVPYYNKKAQKLEAKFQVMYKGNLQLMYRTEKFQVITADEVCSKDAFDYEKGLNAKLYHKPPLGDRGQPIAYYAYYKMVGGGFDFQVMSLEECLEWGRQYSQNFEASDSPWQTATAEMCKKTVIKKLAKYCPVQVALPEDEYDETDPMVAGKFHDITDEPEPEPEPEPEKEPGKEEEKGDGKKVGGSQPGAATPQAGTKEATDSAAPQGAGVGSNAAPVAAAAGAGPGPGSPAAVPPASNAGGAGASGQPPAGATPQASATRLDPHRPMTADQRAAAREIDARRRLEKGKSVTELFKHAQPGEGQRPPFVPPEGKLDTQTGERRGGSASSEELDIF
jgi:recombination protein RecT